MNEKTIEDTRPTRFTVTLPSDTVRKLDMLKACGQEDNRNDVIRDAIELLNYTSSIYGSFISRSNGQTDKVHNENLKNVLSQIHGYIKSARSARYWDGYSKIYASNTS